MLAVLEVFKRNTVGAAAGRTVFFGSLSRAFWGDVAAGDADVAKLLAGEMATDRLSG